MPANTAKPPSPKAGTNATAAKSRSAPAPARKPAPKKAAPARSRGKGGGPRLSLAVPTHLQQEMLAVALVVAAILVALSLAAARYVGLVGSLGDALQGVFGVAAWIVPITLLAAAGMLLIAGFRRIERLRW